MVKCNSLLNRKRDIRFNLYLSKEEKDMIIKISQVTGLSYTDLLVNWIKKDYEKIMEETNNEA